MRRTTWLHSITAFALSISAAALVLDFSALYALRVDVDDSVAGDDSFSPDSDGARQLFHPALALSATPPDHSPIPAEPGLAAFHVILPCEVPESTLVVRATAPRAPPVLA